MTSKKQREIIFNKIFSITEYEIEIRALPSMKRLFSRNLDEIEKFVSQNIRQNLFWSPYTRQGGGTKEHVREVTCFFADLDFKDYAGGETEARKRLDAFINSTGFKPTFIIHSGNGLHIYWFLNRVIEPSQKVEAILRGIAKNLGADINVCELARILRVPGTLNYKNNDRKPVSIIEQNDISYDPGVFDQFEDKNDFKNNEFGKDLSEHIETINTRCNFLKYCFENSAELPEPLWFAMISNLARYSYKPLNLCHAYSQDYPKYNARETEQKIKHCLNDSGPHTCQWIKEQGFNCGKKCGVTSPVVLINLQKDTNETPVIIRLDSVMPEKVEWLWNGHIPIGKITLIDGDPGVGKSLVCTDQIARITSDQPMPDGSMGIQGGAVILTIEDGLADTIVPRLDVAGGDRSKVIALQGIQDEKGNFRFPTVADVKAIAVAIHQVQAKIVVVDPLMGFLGYQVNSWRDQDIRLALSPLIEMAEKEKVAVVVIRHLNKTQHSNAMYRGGGSIGIIGVARVAFLIGKDPEDENKRILAPVKCNLAPMPPALSYTIESVDDIPKIHWGGVSQQSADSLLAVSGSYEEKSALDEAKEFLKEILSEESMSAKDIIKEARNAGISERTLHRAKKLLGVISRKAEFKSGWLWTFPEDCQKDPKAVNNIYGSVGGDLATFVDEDGKNTSDKEAEKNEGISVLEVLE